LLWLLQHDWTFKTQIGKRLDQANLLLGTSGIIEDIELKAEGGLLEVVLPLGIF